MAKLPQIAVVTGAASGMGRLYCQRLASAGVTVAALDINESGLQETAEKYDSIHTYSVNVTDYEQVETTIEKVRTDLGDFDRVMHAAAIMPFGKILEHDVQDIQRVMDINYGGLINITKAAVPHLVKQGRGEFIVFSSMLGIMPVLTTGAYSASKFATSVFMEILANENQGSGVQFMCVCPPAVKTPLLKQAKDTTWPKILDENPPITPEEVLDAIDVALQKGEFWVFPGKGTRMGALMRRLFPQQIWKHIHKVEGW